MAFRLKFPCHLAILITFTIIHAVKIHLEDILPV